MHEIVSNDVISEIASKIVGDVTETVQQTAVRDNHFGSVDVVAQAFSKFPRLQLGHRMARAATEST